MPSLCIRFCWPICSPPHSGVVRSMGFSVTTDHTEHSNVSRSVLTTVDNRMQVCHCAEVPSGEGGVAGKEKGEESGGPAWMVLSSRGPPCPDHPESLAPNSWRPGICVLGTRSCRERSLSSAQTFLSSLCVRTQALFGSTTGWQPSHVEITWDNIQNSTNKKKPECNMHWK